jgi:hypothetical protein
VLQSLFENFKLGLEVAVPALLEDEPYVYAGEVDRNPPACDWLHDPAPAPGSYPRRVDMRVLKVEDRRKEGLELLGRLGWKIDDLEWTNISDPFFLGYHYRRELTLRLVM